LFFGLIIEKVTEQSYEAFLKQEVFEPLAMHNTKYRFNRKVVKFIAIIIYRRDCCKNSA
jgi:CubicO group peptidase (beta-lactamase class C family)